ncbi:hypothetical protein ACOTWJ_05220 [Aliarcobacter butzleri]|uniref:hypothetical protein n=1 Tax=Aliarcobacter butzleri TaxID=28197 RepID=UPI001EDA335D|nr:hypothetical protein [Aliarcobacter butzleri]MCG3676623.1 hypothetical protein [Aliarcobacter butzleri]MCG3687521.1 hypothetical protein [Aliarcobacter butzleri]MCG3703840.1 hypothetical protein [Aliarcobacter butzleri]MCG3708409.1 hypothetical protein [Aliarcobacter butzleri]MDN5088184.1 hypothetical protein [Aliarcobacter butzleri]
MKKIIVLSFLLFGFSNVLADQWDGFFKETGFPRKVIDDGSVVKGKIYQAKVTYQIKNNDGIKGNFENSDSAKVTVTNTKGAVLSTNKFMTAAELRTWARANFTEIFSYIIGDAKLDKKTLMELTNLASVVLLDKNLD